ncbi:unnamed protein product [Fusarium graminearum]|nr:unnamed protein product [Fusarium graminearum]
MPEQVLSIAFGDGNHGLQVGQSNAPIHTTFNLKLEPAEPTPPPFASIPFRRDPMFVNRGDVLEQIDRRCSEPASRVAIVGLGGVGKSQLAIEFAYRFADCSPEKWIFWVHASTPARIVEGFKSIADNIKLMGRNQPTVDILKLVFDWLSNVRNGKWLLILDSADDPDVLLDSTIGGRGGERKLVEYLPQSVNGCVLLTTRNRDLAFRLTGTFQTIHEIGPMTQEEGLKLLENRLGRLSDGDTAVELVRSLDLVPLAISQAAAYIQMRAPRTSLAQYLDQFRQSESKKVKLLTHDAGDLRRDLRKDGGASNTILTTWQVSFDHIRSKRQSAADLLSLMSFFDRQGIPESLVALPKDSRNTAQSNRHNDISDSDTQDSGDKTESGLEDDIAILRNYCLIMQGEDTNTFEMHGLVQLSTRRWLKAQGLQEKFLEQYIVIMARAFPNGDYENWKVCRALFAHVEAAAEYWPKDEHLRKTWADLLHNGGWYALLQGRYATAELMSSQAMRNREEIMGKDHEGTLASTSNLGSTYWNQGRWEEAEKLQVEVMETRKLRLGEDHPDTLQSISNLASTYWSQGRWEEAEKLQVEVMETRKLRLGEDHPDTLQNMSNLALIYRSQGRWEEAEKLQIEVTETSKVKLGEDHPDTLQNMSNLALIHWSQGRWEEAEKLQIEVMETSKVKLGADHPDTLSSTGNLGSTYWNQGRWEEAEKLQVEVMETRKLRLGEDHPSTLMSIGNLASVYQGQGRWEEAEKLQIEVMETSKVKLGADHPDTLTSIGNLAFTYWNQGRWEEAEKLQIEVMETSKVKLGADHPDTLTSIGNLALTHFSQGHWGEAERLQLQVTEAYMAQHGADHPDTLKTMSNLVMTYWRQGRLEEAKNLQIQVMETQKVELGTSHPDTLTSIDNLASIYSNQGKWKRAERLQVGVIKTRKAKLGSSHPDILTSMHNLAVTYGRQGRWDEAERLQTDVMETGKAKLGGSHMATITNSLAWTYWKQGRWEESMELYREVMETRKGKFGSWPVRSYAGV